MITSALTEIILPGMAVFGFCLALLIVVGAV